jgi:hypothetical protein
MQKSHRFCFYRFLRFEDEQVFLLFQPFNNFDGAKII